MTDNSDVHRPSPAMAVDFLRGVHPFSELDEQTLRSLARHIRIDFFPKGTRPAYCGKDRITHLFSYPKRAGCASFITDEGR